MSWRLAESLKTLREQVNILWPTRDRTSDGSIGDAAHSARKSDHNPNAAGVVCAIDIDRELTPDGGITVAELVNRLVASSDRRIKYIIWNGSITVPGNIAQWKPYHGINAHKHHCHISVKSDPDLYDDGSPWHLLYDADPNADAKTPDIHTQTTAKMQRDLRIGDEGEDVKAVQRVLKLTPDGIYGRNTRAAVIAFQANAGLRPDGIVGAQTRREMDL